MKVRELLRVIHDDGWFLARTRGSHRQFKHVTKRGLVTVAGKPGDDIASGTLNCISKISRTQMKKYLVVIEETATGYSAYSPDLPGCIATGKTRKQVEQNIQEAMEFHIEGLRLEGCKIPKPHVYSTYCEIAA